MLTGAFNIQVSTAHHQLVDAAMQNQLSHSALDSNSSLLTYFIFLWHQTLFVHW